MLMISTLLFLAVLSVVLLLAAASYISRGAVRRGAVIILLATGLIGTTAFSIYPALRLTAGADDAFLTAEITTLRLERDQLLVDVNQRARDGEALAKTSAFFSKLHKERLSRISDDLNAVKAMILGPASGMTLATDAEAGVTTFLDGPAGFDAVLADLKHLKSLRLRAPNDPPAATLAALALTRKADAGTTGTIIDIPAAIPPATGPPATGPQAAEIAPAIDAPEPDTLSQLRKALDSKMSTTGYKIEALAEPELVGGRKGRYYLVELKNAKTGDRFTFDSGKYTFQSAWGTYKASFNSFAADVLKQLEPHARFDIYVRGSADAQAYEGQLEPGFEYRKITYLPSTRGTYLPRPATVAVTPVVKNTDLPNLRGEYLRGYLAELYPAKPAMLLEGVVTKKDNPAARNTELILFIAWDNAVALR